MCERAARRICAAEDCDLSISQSVPRSKSSWKKGSRRSLTYSKRTSNSHLSRRECGKPTHATSRVPASGEFRTTVPGEFFSRGPFNAVDTEKEEPLRWSHMYHPDQQVGCETPRHRYALHVRRRRMFGVRANRIRHVARGPNVNGFAIPLEINR